MGLGAGRFVVLGIFEVEGRWVGGGGARGRRRGGPVAGG
jgi:hypothetical protein